MSPILDDPRGTFTGGGGVGNVSAPTLGSGKRLTLNLGVIVQPYRSESKSAGAVTTGDVAQWLEKRYGVMEVFARVHSRVIENALVTSVEGALEALVMGRRVDPFARATQAITTRFKRYINSYEAERVGIPGTPTGAALRGVSHRLAHPYRKSNPRRPSFRDTGTYEASAVTWVSS